MTNKEHREILKEWCFEKLLLSYIEYCKKTPNKICKIFLPEYFYDLLDIKKFNGLDVVSGYEKNTIVYYYHNTNLSIRANVFKFDVE